MALLRLALAVSAAVPIFARRPPASREELLRLIQSPKPPHVDDVAFDCAWRYYALQYASQIQPWLTAAQLQMVNDSLAFATSCAGVSYTPAPFAAPSSPASYPSPAPGLSASACTGVCVFVDPAIGSDVNPGSQAAPKRTIPGALAVTRTSGSASPTIILRGGTYYINATISLTPGDSGLTITAFDGETPVVSGGVPVAVSSWAPYNVTLNATWGPVQAGMNAVFGQCGNPGVPNKGVMASWEACQASCQAADAAACTAWTWNGPGIPDPAFQNVCCWRTDGSYAPVPEDSTWSQGRSMPQNVWVATLPAGSLAAVPAMQVNGARATLARFPNSNPELDLFPAGYVDGGAWLPPADEGTPFTYTVVLPPGQEDPGAGIYINYTVGIGGTAARYSPPRSFWASRDFGPQAYQPTHIDDRWDEMHLRSPSGLDFNGTLPHAPYAHGSGAVVHTWRPGHWYMWMFELGPQLGAESYNFSAGGTQGGEGSDTGAEWWIENVFEELDAPNEYYFDSSTSKLYFFYNATPGTPPPPLLVLPTLSVFFDVRGSEASPVAGMTLQGLSFTAGAPTFMEPRSVPSGGDWALERLGAVLLQGTTGFTVANCTFTRLDGNAVFLSGYNRNATVAQSEFSWLGQSAIAAWGETDEWDGTGGQQPRFTAVVGNLAYAVGLIQKQSSFYFQAASCQNTLAGNIIFNIPRAAFNFDDGFGGATELRDNLAYNTCQESSDHGAFNSGCLDNDDGSSWYNIYENFCVYGGHKSDFDGHSKHSYGNLHVYPAVYGPRCMLISAQLLPALGYPEVYVNNTCILAAAGQPVLGLDNRPIPPPVNFTVTLGGNTIYAPNGSAVVQYGPTVPFQAFQAEGYDAGSVVNATVPDAPTIISWAQALLGAGAH